MIIPFLTPDLRPELDLRVEKVRKAMQVAGLKAILVSSTANILYLSGCIFRGYIFLSVEDGPLFITIPPSVTEASSDTVTLHKPELIPGMLQERGMTLPEVIGLEYNDMFYNEVERLKGAFAGCGFSNASPILMEARMIKTPYEIEKMKEDGEHHVAAYSRIESCYWPGMTDIELQIEVERVLRREGCLGYLRVAGSRMEINMGSVIAGDNADMPSPYDFSMGGAGADPSLPVGADGTELRNGMSVMLDMNGGFNGYQTDMTRTWYVGSLPDLAFRAHDCSLKILHELERDARPGMPLSDMYRRSMEIVNSEGLEDYFMGHRNHVKFIGHGVGIQLNEQPVIMERTKAVLAENMTLAIEPKFVVPGVGALGIENTYRVGADGLENLTPMDESLKELKK